jgi:hypothetical protein
MEKLVHVGLDLADSSILTANPACRSSSMLKKTTKNQFHWWGEERHAVTIPAACGALEARGRRTKDGSPK